MTSQISNGVNQFNIVIVGTGGQGLITLLQIIAEAALIEGYDLKTSELHGLSQRGGSVEAHIRFGKKIHSPLVAQGKADLIIGLEMQECLKATYFANSKTNFLINKYIVPIPLQKPLPESQILRELRKVSKKIDLVEANGVTAGVYLLSFASFKNLIPLKPDSIFKAIKKVIPKQYLELNEKTFELAKKHEKI